MVCLNEIQYFIIMFLWFSVGLVVGMEVAGLVVKAGNAS